MRAGKCLNVEKLQQNDANVETLTKEQLIWYSGMKTFTVGLDFHLVIRITIKAVGNNR